MTDIFKSIAIVLIFFLVACGSQKQEDMYYPLEKYFEEQVHLLDSLNYRVIKIVSKDGKSESINSDSLNWKNELKPFLDAELNKPVYQKKFLVDTLRQDNYYSLVYSAIDPKMELTYVMIDFDSLNQILQVNMKTNAAMKSNRISASLNFKTMDSYSVELVETNESGEQHNYSAYTRFLKK